MKFKLLDGRLQRQLPVSQFLSPALTPQFVELAVPASQPVEQVAPEIPASQAIEQVLVQPAATLPVLAHEPQAQVSTEPSSQVVEQPEVRHETIFPE